MKNKTLALILSILLGGLGVDRFYLGYIGIGVLKLLTGGCFGILYIIDVVNIATGKLTPADGSPYEEDSFSGRAAPARPADPYEDLEKLARLHNEGVLTDEEFAQMKAECLSRI